MKIFLSTPFRGKTEPEVRAKLNFAEMALKEAFGHEIEVIHNYDYNPTEEVGNFGMKCIAEAIRKMSECDAIAFIGNWKFASGCRIEYDVAKKFGMTIIMNLDE